MDKPYMKDRGKPIPGSKYFRQYCSVCNEPIRVNKHNRWRDWVTCDKCIGIRQSPDFTHVNGVYTRAKESNFYQLLIGTARRRK